MIFGNTFGPFGRRRASRPAGGTQTLRILNDKELSQEFLRAHNAIGPLPRVNTRRIVGVDLGQSQDPAAAVMLELDATDSEFVGPRDTRIWCRYIREWPLQYDYYDLCSDIFNLTPDVIVPEMNGVGRPVVDVMRRMASEVGFRGHILPVVSTASNAKLEEHREARGRHLTVPKVDLISAISILQQRQLLRFVGCGRPSCPGHCGCDVNKLLSELRTFQKRYSRSANLQFGNEPRAGAHDDIVIALGLAAFYSLRFGFRREPAIAF